VDERTIDPAEGDRLARALTQEQFGDLVGISQQAVSDLMQRGVIAAGEVASVWLRAYCDHLREMAAGRDPNGQLATERTRLAREQADRVAMNNAVERKQFAPIELLEDALASISRQVATKLDAIVPQLRRRHPELSGEVLRSIADSIAQARQVAADSTLQSATADDINDDVDEPPEVVA